MLTLYTYYRSSASYRVRIALALKGLQYESKFVHLVRNGGQQHAPEFVAINPAELVPALRDGAHTFTQSLAILEYLDERYPATRLLPNDILGRARVRSIAQSVASEIHPINNLRVLKYLEREIGANAEAKKVWYSHWVTLGFAALESSLAASADTGEFCHGDRPTIADCCLVPQVYNARRFDIDLSEYPTIRRIDEACRLLPAFRAAAPESQFDAA